MEPTAEKLKREKNRLKMKRYRENLKKDPVRYENYLKNKREMGLRDRDQYRRAVDKIRKRKWIEQKKARVKQYLSDKPCSECGEDNLICLDFHRNSRDDKNIRISRAIRDLSLDDLQNEMKKCIILCANCHKKHHRNISPVQEDSAHQWGETNRRRRQRNKDWVNKHKARGCIRCNENDYICLDFHHRDPNTKIATISRMVNATRSIKSIQEEIKKCDLLCANCHRKEHC